MPPSAMCGRPFCVNCWVPWTWISFASGPSTVQFDCASGVYVVSVSPSLPVLWWASAGT